MNVEKLKLTSGCWFEYDNYIGIELWYTERQADSYYSDPDTYIDISKENAEKMIIWLQDKVDKMNKKEGMG